MVNPKRILWILSVLAAASLLAACAPVPGPSPAPTLSGPLTLSLTTDADSYRASTGEIQVTLTNAGSEPVYLAVCEPLSLVEADTLNPVWITLCEIDYLGHKIEAGGSFVDRVLPNAEPGAYRIQTTVHAHCTLGEPVPIGPGQANYGSFRDCRLQQDIVSEPFDLK